MCICKYVGWVCVCVQLVEVSSFLYHVGPCNWTQASLWPNAYSLNNTEIFEKFWAENIWKFYMQQRICVQNTQLVRDAATF